MTSKNFLAIANFVVVNSFLLCSSRTCPSCRKEPINPVSLIKLFFEQDESKAALSIDEILKTNDELTKKLKEEKDKLIATETKLFEANAKLNESTDRTKFLERQKQLDDMAIAGLKSIKEDSTKELIKLQETNKRLKIDYLAERQLRRTYQIELHKWDPENENYNSDSIHLDGPQQECGGENSNGSPNKVTRAGDDLQAENAKRSPSFWSKQHPLNCEAKQIDKDWPKTSPRTYIIPSKIQKGTSAPKRLISPPNKFAEHKPQAFSFFGTSSSSPIALSDAQPSTSAGAKPKLNKTFGEDKTASKLSFISAAASTSAPSGFDFKPLTGKPNITFNFSGEASLAQSSKPPSTIDFVSPSSSFGASSTSTGFSVRMPNFSSPNLTLPRSPQFNFGSPTQNFVSVKSDSSNPGLRALLFGKPEVNVGVSPSEPVSSSAGASSSSAFGQPPRQNVGTSTKLDSQDGPKMSDR